MWSLHCVSHTRAHAVLALGGRVLASGAYDSNHNHNTTATTTTTNNNDNDTANASDRLGCWAGI